MSGLQLVCKLEEHFSNADNFEWHDVTSQPRAFYDIMENGEKVGHYWVAMDYDGQLLGQYTFMGTEGLVQFGERDLFPTFTVTPFGGGPYNWMADEPDCSDIPF